MLSVYFQKKGNEATKSGTELVEWTSLFITVQIRYWFTYFHRQGVSKCMHVNDLSDKDWIAVIYYETEFKN